MQRSRERKLRTGKLERAKISLHSGQTQVIIGVLVCKSMDAGLLQLVDLDQALPVLRG